MSAVILLIAPESISLPIAEALRHDLRAEVECIPNRRSALALLRRQEFSLILVDETLTNDPGSADLLYQNATTAVVVELNLAISGAARIVRQARAALTRRAEDRAHARFSVAAELQSELNTMLAGILLESQLALRETLPEQAPRLVHLVQLAEDLRNRLRP